MPLINGAVQIVGTEKMAATIRAFAKTYVPIRVMDGVERIGERIMTRSKEEFVPTDLSPLKNSGFVERESNDSVILAYGGEARDYALAVHDHPSKHSPPSWQKSKKPVQFHPPGRGPGYLRIPVMEAARTFAVDLKKEIQF